MKKANVEELTRKLNEFRMSNQNTTFTGKELNQKLMEIGFSTVMASAVAQKYFPYEQVGKGRLYGVPEKPIHKDAIYVLFDKQNRRRNKKQEVGSNSSIKMDQQKAWDTLVEAGVIRTKFNLTTLKSKYPKIYLECLDYELVR